MISEMCGTDLHSSMDRFEASQSRGTQRGLQNLHSSMDRFEANQ